jgi:hypothetical protein
MIELAPQLVLTAVVLATWAVTTTVAIMSVKHLDDENPASLDSVRSVVFVCAAVVLTALVFAVQARTMARGYWFWWEVSQ